MMTTAQVVETSVTVNDSPIQDLVHPDDQTQPTFEMTPGLKRFTLSKYCILRFCLAQIPLLILHNKLQVLTKFGRCLR